MKLKPLILILVMLLLVSIANAQNVNEVNIQKLINATIFKQPTINASIENSTNKNVASAMVGTMFNQSSVCINQSVGGCYWEMDVPASSQAYVEWTKKGSQVLINNPDTNMSGGGWFNISSKSGGYRKFFDSSDVNADGRGIEFYWTGADQGDKLTIIIYPQTGSSQRAIVQGNGGFPLNVWQHVWFDWNDTAQILYVYVNGTIIGQAGLGAGGGATVNSAIRIGWDYTPATENREFEGVAQGFLIMNISTNASERALLSSKYYMLPDSVTSASVSDATSPIANATLNSTSPKINEVVNISVNATDETGLSFCQFINNQTGSKVFINTSISGTSDRCFQAFTVSVGRGNVINFSVVVNDTSNNKKTNVTIITVANTIPTHTAPTLNSTDGLNRTNANLTGFNQSGLDADTDQIVSNTIWYKNKVKNATRWINDANLVLYLPFDGNSTKDFSGKENDGTATNGANVTPDGKISEGYMFDGTDDYVNVKNDTNTYNFAGNFTLSAWIKTSTGDFRTVIGNSGFANDVSARGYGLRLGQTVDGQLIMRIGDGTAEYNAVSTTSDTFHDGNWHYLVGMFNGSYISVWADGIEKGSTAFSGSILYRGDNIQVGRNTGASNFWKGTIDEIAIYNRSLSESEIRQIYWGSVNGFANLNASQTKKNENWTIEMTPYDVVSSGTPLNSTQLTILNTAPISGSYSNTSDLTFNKNQTLAWNACSDADVTEGIDTITYDTYFDVVNPPLVLINNDITDRNFTTNMTAEVKHFLNVTCTDSTATDYYSIFNITLDVSTPVCSNIPANGTYYNSNKDFNITCTDNNQLAEINFTLRDLSNNILNSSNATNLTVSSYIINYTLKTNEISDGHYNLTWWAGDTKNKAREFSYGKHSVSGDNKTIQFNNTHSGTQINLTFGTENPAGIWLPSTSALGLQTTVTDVATAETGIYPDYYKYASSVLLPNTQFMLSIRISSNHPVYLANNGYYYTGIGKERTALPIDDLIKNGFEVETWNDGTYYYYRVKKGTNSYIQGNRILFDPKLDNNLVTEEDTEIIIDTGLPTLAFFNISSYANNSFAKVNFFNITVNASDTNPSSARLYIDDKLNLTVTYTSNASINITNVNIGADGNYTLKVEVNDSAGNKVNFSYSYNLVVDTTLPTFSHTYNRTVNGNSTNILENTDINATIILLKDTYLNRGNFSHNASGPWTNHTIPISANETDFSYVIGSGNFTANQVVGWKFYVYDLAGNELDPIYTFTVGSSASGTTSQLGGSTNPSGSAVLSQTQELTEELKKEQQADVNEQVQAALCSENLPFMKRLFSKCKIADNGICEDGENFLMDKDCMINTNDIASGKILTYMWFLRFIILLSIYLLAIDHKNFSFAVIAIMVLLVYNGAFPVEGVDIQNKINAQDEIIGNAQGITDASETTSFSPPSKEEMACMDINFFVHLGQCINPSNPTVGWAIVIVLAMLVLNYFRDRLNNRSRKH